MNRIAILAMLAALACGDDDGMVGADGGSDVGGDAPMADVGMLDSTADAADSMPPGLCDGDPILDPLSGDVAFAVIGTDFTSTSVGLLDAAGDVHTDAWIDSGTSGAGLVATLGGDVVLPTTSSGSALDLLDRFGVDVGTRICPNGVVVGQLAFSPGEFATNLHDWVIRGDEGWATRYEQNPDGSAADVDLGNDLVGFDPTTMSLNGVRIDLGMFDDEVTGLDSAGAEATVQVSARPDTIVFAGGALVVGLGRLPQNLFGDARGHGEGRVAIVDPGAGTVSAVELNGLANCGLVVPVTGSDDEVLVSCLGYSDVGFGDAAGERATAGIARISVSGGLADVVTTWRVSDDVDNLLSVYTPVSLGGDSVVAVAPGDFVATNDTLVHIDLGTGEQTTVVVGSGSFVIGQGATNGTGLLLVPDTTVGVRRFDTTDFSEDESVNIGPAPLPPTMIRAF